ncbi:cyclin-domain-containing protein, partial [Sodiomyces alkalinus F11]
PPPTPSSDPSLVSFAAMLPESVSKGPYEEVWRMAPRTAMKILAISIEALVHSTGDIPSTAPSTAVTTHHLRGMQWEKDNIKRSNSERELALMRERAEAQAKAEAEAAAAMAPDVPLRRTPSHDLSLTPGPIDGIRLRSTSTSTFAHHPPPSSSSSSSEPKIVWANTEPHKEQHNAITRKFYCRKPPPITVTDYLERLHSYCPTSTAVYLATSLYIYRLAVDERVIHVTPRTVHRLVLGALRVTMKALEDQRYGHRKMARVGGVGEPELARLEIGFCFLTNFELFLRDADLAAHLEVLR